ncbi:MAG: methyltransferase domain-containing protein [Acidobacteria bacterium]|nr:methyltransferase domain-containing protein [Acidobacteriota bacterium]
MHASLLDLLACPDCRDSLELAAAETEGGDIVTGTLACRGCGRTHPVVGGIPRFVAMENYATSFGYQWNRFRGEQIDAANGTRLSEDRLYGETGWRREWLPGRWILDVGCGAGRFLEVVSREKCRAVGVDLSRAVDAARLTLKDRGNVDLVQASIEALPFKPGAFDLCYCIGVIQHTPSPRRSLAALPAMVKSGGRLAVTIYERRRWTTLNAKYLVRPITRRMNKRALLLAIQALMPLLFPLTEVLFRLPLAGRLFAFAIPVANYVGEARLSIGQRYRWAVLDTFDMLSPEYDRPQTESEAAEALARGGLAGIVRRQAAGLTLAGIKP